MGSQESKVKIERVVEHPYFKALFSALVGVLLFVALRIQSSVDESTTQMNNLVVAVAKLASSSEERFSAQDRLLNQSFTSIDKRITRLEDNQDRYSPQKSSFYKISY